MSATSGGGGSVSEGSEAGGSTQSTMSVSDSPSTSFQTNMAENVTKITLSEENSAGSFGADVTGSKINLSLDERQQKDGIVNVAFDYEEGTNRGGGGVGGGDFKLINGSEKKDKVPEAVNLELVNMVPYSNGNGTSYGVPVNGIPTKKDSEQVDISTPYDEYFVPVNEHKKYMRGEKLYVTKDKRRPTSWRRCLSWVVACTVISIVLILAILAGTGVILSQEPNLVKEASVGRNFAGSNLKPSVTDKTQPTPTAEMYMYVPRSIESEFVIDNLDFDPAFKDRNSSAYQQFAAKMEDQLKMVLFDKELLEVGASDVGLKVVNISRDPFKVNYRIGWNYKQGVNNPPEPIKMEDVKKRLVESLARNQGYIDKYHIDREAIKVNHVINTCKMDNGGCSHICYYNYVSQQFTCTCPTHLILHANGKNCIPWNGSSEDDASEVPGKTANPAHEQEFGAHYEHEDLRGTHYHFENENENNSEPSPEPGTKGGKNEEHGEHEPIAEPVPEPTAESGPNHKSSSPLVPESKNDKEHVHLSGNNFDSGATLEPAANPNAEDHYHVVPIEHESKEPAAEPTPESTVDSFSEVHQHNFHSEHEFKEHEPSAEPTPKVMIDSDGIRDHDLHSKYETKDHEPSAEPTPEPSTNSDDREDYNHSSHSVYGFKEQEPLAEPTPEPTINSDDKDHDDHSSHSDYDFKEHEVSEEPKPEPTPKKTVELSSEGRSHDHDDVHSMHKFNDDELFEDPTPEPGFQSTAEGKSHRHAGESVFRTKDFETTTELTFKSTSKPVVLENSDIKKHEHADDSVVKNHETEAAPGFESATGGNSHGGNEYHEYHTVHGLEDQESPTKPASESVPETTLNPNSEGKNRYQGDHFMVISKNQESGAEVPPELGSKMAFDPNSEEQTHNGNSPYKPSDHELVAETTPKTSSAQSTTKSRTKEKDYDFTMHSLYGAQDHEPETELTPELESSSEGSTYNHNDLNDFSSKGQGITPGASFESGTEFNRPKLPSVYESSDSQPNPDSKLETKTEPTSEPIFEPSLANTSSNSGARVENKTTVDSGTPQKVTNTEFNPSGNGNHQSVPSQSKTLTETPSDSVNNGNTEHPMNILHNLQSEPNKNKPEHHVPYLEDILIKRPSPSSENQNETNISQNPLDNVELTANGQPVIEEILIDKSDRKSTDQVKPGESVSETLSTKPSEGFDNFNSAVLSRSNETSTEPSDFKAEPNSNLTTQNVQEDLATEHPRIVEYIAGQYPTQEKDMGKEIQKANSEEKGSSQNGFEYTTKSNDQDLYRSSPHETDSSFASISVKSESTLGPSYDNTPVTTMSSQIHHESQTIPTTVEFSIPGENKVSTEAELKGDNQTDKSEIKTRRREEELTENTSKNVEVLNQDGDTRETEYKVANDFNSSKTFSEHKTKIYETGTESLITTTTLHSVVTPEAVEKENGRLENDKDGDEKAVDYKTNGEITVPEGSERTKSPEEISNTIKDELQDNEEFNTLIDKEYKNKESTPIEGKEAIKYPSKPFKPEKKKLKDFTKGEKLESDKKAEATVRPAVTPEDFILQKHVNGNENTFDLDYSLPNEHTTKHDGGVTIIDPHGIEGVPGVSLKPYGINNHDISVLQTVAPDFRTETGFLNGGQEAETLKSDFKNKPSDNKDGESKLDKDYKFDKDYKYEKQKVSKKKDLKKKVGGKDGKNVELEEGRKYFTEVTKDDWDVSQEMKGVPETTMNPMEKITFESETGIKIIPGLTQNVTAVPESTAFGVKSDGPETTLQPGHPVTQPDTKFKMGYVPKVGEGEITEHPDFKSENVQADPNKMNISEETTKNTIIKPQDDEQIGHLMIEEPTVKSTYSESPGTVFDGQLNGTESSDLGIQHVIMNASFPKEQGSLGSPEMYDGITDGTTIGSTSATRFENSDNTQDGFVQNTTFIVYESTASPLNVTTNSSIANPTIIIHGQSGNLQNGHILRFANSTLQNSGNATILSMLNGTLNQLVGHSPSKTNYTTTSFNSSVVQPTILVHGQSGTLQDGHEVRFGNSTFQTSTSSSSTSTTSSGEPNRVYTNSNVYRIDNASVPGTVFDGHFNPQNGHYHMFTNTSGTFVYSNSSTPPAFIIKGESGDFGNSTAYIIENSTRSGFPGGFNAPYSVIFRNSTVFAVENTESDAAGVKEITVQPHEPSNETIHFTHQVTPTFVSSGTAYKVNNYFGYISKCAAGQFQCLNGISKRGSSCISLSSKCDSVNDCSDGSDELGCIEKGCPGNFQCTDSTCLKRNLVCNGILDCSDGSDEKNCESWKCEFDEFQCPSGRCIPVVWQCDNKPDCDNHTDEYNCQTSCGNDEYLCPEGWCIPLTYKCNGIKECNNGEDEQLCDCSHEEFKCQTGGCVSMKQVCDGLDDCPDRSDEWDCVKLEPKSNLLKIKNASGIYEPVCADNWSSKYSDKVCASLGYFASVPIENENSSVSSFTTETSFYVLKNDTTADFNRKIIVNLNKSEGNCSSQKLVEISCQEFSCGSRSMTDSSSVEARLVGGMSATAGQWPSVTLLYNIRNFHSCTANVLTPRWVLASYNCLKMGNKIFNEQDWKFFGGSTIFEAERENAETRKVLSIIPHPQVKFNQFLFTNDLALIELDQPLQFASNLGAVCLPEQEMQPRQICVTAGWGINTPEDKAIRQQLQYLPVPTMNLTECNSTEHYSGFITDDKICAGYNSAQKSLCYNEEGAPLMCVNDRGEWELQGVLSYQSNCGRGSHPSIFSSITPVKDWIKKTIGNNFQRKPLAAVSNR